MNRLSWLSFVSLHIPIGVPVSAFVTRNLFHTSTSRLNAHRFSLGGTRRGTEFIKQHRCLMMRPDGTVVYARIAEPRFLIQLPLDVNTLNEDAKRARLAGRKPRVKQDAEEEMDDDFDFARYTGMLEQRGRGQQNR